MLYKPGDEDLYIEENPPPGSPDCAEMTTVAIDISIEMKDIKIYPNPISGPLRLKLKILKTESMGGNIFRLFDLFGKPILRPVLTNHSDQEIQLPVILYQGIYFLIIYDQSAKIVFNEKLLKL